MSQLRKGLFHNPFHRRKKSENAKAQTNQVKIQEDDTTNALLPTSPSQSTIQPAQPTPPTQSTQTSRPLDLWKTAFDQLDDEERRILSTIQIPTNLENEENHSKTDVVVSEVIQITEAQYEKYQQRAEGKLRRTSQKIINAALSFKDIIGAIAASDPTNHAASAWTIVSLGLTMIENHNDLRGALFESSEYLADILAQCAFIEKNFYRNRDSSIKDDVGNALARLYRAILHYTVQIRNAQDPSIGRKLLDCVTAITEHPLTELKASVEKERDNIHKWIGLVEYLHREKEAESILCRIDELAECVKLLIEQFSLVNLRVAEGAFYDSYANQHEGFCLEDTRTELRSQIAEWAESSDGKCIFWLNGMAGTGKSTIARTVAKSLKEKGQLGATFFFKKGEADRGDAKYLISTIIKQLVTSHRQLVPGVLKAIENDPNISAKSLSEQFEKLLLQPLLSLNRSEPITTIIVIDALDECEHEDDIRAILQLLPQVQESESMHLRIFLTSRPELPIRLGFKQNNAHQDLVLHELPSPVIEHDIRLYLEETLSRIRDERSLPSNWPGNETIEELVRMAVPLFIFAATTCRFIKDGTHPKKRLQKLLEFQATTSTSQMDKLYLPVLNQLTGQDEDDPKELLEEFQDIVGVIILLATPLSVNSLAQLLEIPADDISELLDGLHSVLNISSDTDAPVRILHLSFRDYLLNTKSAFHVHEKETHQKIALHCLHVMNTSLKHNICGLSSYGTQRMDIDSQVIKQHLSADLQYSCHYWVYHLKHSEGHVSESKIFAFLKIHFLHWLEALSLMGVIFEAVGMIDVLWSGVGRNTDAEISDFLYDAKRFILKNIFIASTAPLQLYCSGLAFSPPQSTIRKLFRDDTSKWIHTLPQGDNTWCPILQKLTGHLDAVISVAFSRDGQTLASGSRDKTIKLWDAKTGKELQTVTGHSGLVSAVAFSPDGRTLASGSCDKTIKIWNTKTGKELQTIIGHLDLVESVAFSPDGKTLASGSRDKTIKIWDTKTGKELQTITGNSEFYSIAFSPNGQTLASGSLGGTIKLWDANTGKELQTLTDHSSPVYSVAFSPDGQFLASGTGDKTIKLWDAKTGRDLQTLKGHSSLVDSVANSLPTEGHPGTRSSDVPLLHGDRDPTPSSFKPEVFLSDNWVALAGENLLWVPPEDRRFVCLAFKDGTLALGYGDGRFLIIGFHSPID